VGSAIALCLNLFSFAFFWLIEWIVNDHVVKKNLAKLRDPSRPFMERAAIYFLLLLVDIVLSWISVIWIILRIIYALFLIIRSLFESVPEEVKLLRFPLRNNPSMSREAVWAYATALDVRSGKPWDGFSKRTELKELNELYPGFSCSEALNIFKGLKIVDPDTVGEWFE
ncbi:MAG TPA: hypothetical protein VIH90_07390, partial [Candidatus Saccharimonadales bacterium]